VNALSPIACELVAYRAAPPQKRPVWDTPATVMNSKLAPASWDGIDVLGILMDVLLRAGIEDAS